MMKKRMKALLAIGLSAIIMVCSAGCGNGKEHMKAETDPDIPVEDVSFPLKEKAELSFITSAPATSTQEPNERTIFKRLEKQTNVHIDWTCFVSDQFDDKKNLALAQFGNLPDGLFNAGMSDYDLLRYAKQGIIIPVENLIDKYMPNLKAVFEKYPEYRTMCTAPDGHIYSFRWIEQLGAGKEAIQAIGDIPYINKKWLDYLKLDVPTTTEELEQVLVAFRDNADKLEKIVFNLLSNAFKYTPNGKMITMFIREDEKTVSIGVQDQGIGIAENKKKSLFVRFENLVDKNLFNQASTGIGLSLVKELVEMHKATISVDSHLGEGSCFKVDFVMGKEHYD